MIATSDMPPKKRPSEKNVIALLNQYKCPTPFHAVRARFMGTIASPLMDRSPVHAIQELWGGELPPVAAIEDLNNLLQVLMDGVWNRLTIHQSANKPFKLTLLAVEHTGEGLHHYGLVRQQEIEGFMDGLFGPHEEMDLPESARDAVTVLGEMRSMFAGAVALLEDDAMPADPHDLRSLSENFQEMATILEVEMNKVIVSCTRARRELLAAMQQTKPTVH